MATAAPLGPLPAADLNFHLADTYGALLIGLLISAVSVLFYINTGCADSFPVSCFSRIVFSGSPIYRYLCIRSLTRTTVSGVNSLSVDRLDIIVLLADILCNLDQLAMVSHLSFTGQ